jgi:hypothetical protein
LKGEPFRLVLHRSIYQLMRPLDGRPVVLFAPNRSCQVFDEVLWRVVKHSTLEEGFHIGGDVSLDALNQWLGIEECGLRKNVTGVSDIDVFQNCH